MCIGIVEKRIYNQNDVDLFLKCLKEGGHKSMVDKMLGKSLT